MIEDRMTVEDYTKAYSAWLAKYRISEWIDNDDEGVAKVMAMDPRYVWTNHSTCDNEQISTGAEVFTGICWTTFGWHVGEVAWENPFEVVESSMILPCEVCNLDEEGSTDEDCKTCEGNGYAHHYFD